MKILEGGLGRAFLRFASPFVNLRRLPLLGPALRWAGAKLIPRDSLTWVQVQHGPAKGTWLQLNPRTGSGYFQGHVEPEVQTVLQEYLRPGMVFYDIGANIGFFSLLAARLVGSQGRVVAFEADPEIASRLRENIAHNPDVLVSVVEKAVWSSSNPVFFARADTRISPDRGLGHVVEQQATDAAQAAIRVSAISLDDFVAGSVAPDFIKCDVEGAEVEVFRSALKLLSEKKPAVLCEMHSKENRRVLLEQFAHLGYRCEPCGGNHIFAQVAR